jgi:hypothetical protein
MPDLEIPEDDPFAPKRSGRSPEAADPFALASSRPARAARFGGDPFAALRSDAAAPDPAGGPGAEVHQDPFVANVGWDPFASDSQLVSPDVGTRPPVTAPPDPRAHVDVLELLRGLPPTGPEPADVALDAGLEPPAAPEALAAAEPTAEGAPAASRVAQHDAARSLGVEPEVSVTGIVGPRNADEASSASDLGCRSLTPTAALTPTRPPAAVATPPRPVSPARTGTPAGASEPGQPPPAPAPAPPALDGRLRGVLRSSLSLALLIAVAVALFLVWNGGVAARLQGMLGRGEPTPLVEPVGVHGGWYDTAAGVPLLAVKGQVRAHAPVGEAVRVRVELLQAGSVVASAEGLAGATATPEQVFGAGTAADSAALRRALDAASRPLAAGETAPFLVLFPPPLPDARGLELRVRADPSPRVAR